MGFEITDTFAEPYSQATASLPSSFSPSVIGVNGIPYLLDTTQNKYNRRSIPVVEQRNTGDQRDLLLLPQNIWRQTVSGWHYGAGQSHVDRDDALPFRFSESYGIDPWTKWQISILPLSEQHMDLSNQTASAHLVVHGSDLVVSASAGLVWWDGLGPSASSTFQNLSYDVADVAYDGENVIVLDTQGDVKYCPNPSTATTHVSLTDPTFIGYNKDYLISNESNVLVNITSGSASAVYVHPITSFRWVDSCEGPNAIYVLGGIADKWVVHRLSIKSDGTGLDPAIVAAQLPDGEIGYSIGSYLGFVFIGTDKGVRMAQPNANGDLLLGPIIPTNDPVKCFEGQDRFVWYGISSMDATYSSVQNDQANVFPTGQVCGLGRMDLSQFTVTSLTPAFANDLAAPEESGKTVQSVVTYLGKRVYAINGGGVYYESDVLMPGGWLSEGFMSFSVEDLKTGLYQQAKWLPGCAGKIYFDIAFDSTGYGRYGEITISNNIRSDNLSLHGVQFSRMKPRYVLTRCSIDNTVGPIMTRWEMRSVAVRGQSSRWELPIMLHDEIEIDSVKYVRDVNRDFDALMSLVESGIIFVFQESGRSYQTVARDFVWQAEKLSSNGRGWQGVYTLVVEEVM